MYFNVNQTLSISYIFLFFLLLNRIVRVFKIYTGKYKILLSSAFSSRTYNIHVKLLISQLSKNCEHACLQQDTLNADFDEYS